MTILETWQRALWALATVAASASTALASDVRPQPVGMRAERFADEARRDWSGAGPRPLATSIWYPAVAGAQEQDWVSVSFKAGRSARDAPLAPGTAPLPLIVLSHGTGGAAAGIAWLGEALAAHGYIVAAVNHHGNTVAEPTQPLQGTLVWWDRPKDVSVLIDRLLADPAWGPRIDKSRIGAAGFSIGGYTALASVGARLSRAQWRAFCQNAATAVHCELPPEVSSRFPPGEDVRLLTQDPRIIEAVSHMEDDFRDPRIRAAFSIAPVVGAAVQRASLQGISVPVHIVVGEDDDQAAPRWNAQPLAQAIPNAKLDIYPKVTHYSFLPACVDDGAVLVKESCADAVGVDRSALHRRVAALAIGFFAQALRVIP